MVYYQDDGTVATKAITVASQQAGKPYIWGAAGPDTFDCSGLVHYAYSTAGLPGAGAPTSHSWTTATIRFMGDAISAGQEQPGDLIMPTAGHVGICIGNGQMWNAPETGIPVRIDKYPTNVFAIRRVSSPASGIQSAPGSVTTAAVSSGPLAWWQSFLDTVNGFQKAATWLSDGHNWMRIGEVVGGVALLYSSVKMGN